MDAIYFARALFAGKAGLGAALVITILVPTAIVLSWWNGAIENSGIFGRETFGIAGWDLVAYGLFVFALTLFVGATIRRVGWTLAAAVALFVVVAVAVPSAVRPHLAPKNRTLVIALFGNNPGAGRHHDFQLVWILRQRLDISQW